VPYALGGHAAQISQNVALSYRYVGGEVDAFDLGAVCHAITGLCTGCTVPQINTGAAGEARQAVLSQKLVVDRDTLLDGREAEQVVQAPYPAWVAFDADFPTLHMDRHRRGIAGLMLEPRLSGGEHLISVRVDCDGHHIAHNRKVVLMLLRHR